MSDGNGWRNLWAGLMVALMVVLVGATIQLHATMGVFRVEVERRFGEVNGRLARMDERLARMDERLARMDERLANVEAVVHRLDPDHRPSAGGDQ